MRSILSIFLFFLFTFSLFATKASPLPILVRQPDGSQIEVLIKGDEHFRYTTTRDGYIIAQAKDGFYYFADYSSGKLNISPTKVSLSSRPSLAFKTKSIPENVRRRNLESREISYVSSGNKKIKTLVLLVEFLDVKFTISGVESHFENFINQQGYSSYGATGSVNDYFRDNLSDYYSFDFDVSQVISLPNNLEYYGANDEYQDDVEVMQMIADACGAANSLVDFSQYDVDRDGVVDKLFIIFAGYNEAEGGGANTIWPHSWDVNSSNLVFDGVKIGDYGCTSEYRGSQGQEPAGIGTFCHEFGHLLGLIDLYDVDGANNGQSNALWGSLSLMDAGNYNNNGRTPPFLCAVDRELLGALKVDTLKVNKSYSLWPIGEAKRAGIILTSTSNEYFLFENRTQKNWDSYIGGSGLVVYHIDKSESNAGGILASIRWNYNLINSNSDHECANLVEANRDANVVEDVFFPGKNNITKYSSGTNPAFVDWQGRNPGVMLDNISYDSDAVFFNVKPDAGGGLYPVVSSTITPYQKKVLLEWTTTTDAHIKWGLLFGETSKFDVENAYYTTLKKKYEFDDLKPNTEYSCELFHVDALGNADTLDLNFKTLGLSSAFPYISGIMPVHKRGDVIDLRLFNLNEQATSISWYINGIPVREGKNVLNDEGKVEITVVIEYAKDESKDIIKRIINVGSNEL